jgi:hypothetical protein
MYRLTEDTQSLNRAEQLEARVEREAGHIAVWHMDMCQIDAGQSVDSEARIRGQQAMEFALKNEENKISENLKIELDNLKIPYEENGHSFAIFADHDSVEGRRLGLEKNYDGFDAFIEVESSTPSGDLLVFFSPTTLEGASPKELSKAAYERFQGNLSNTELFVSVSHPSHNKRPWTQLDRFPDGMELVNFDSLFWRKLISNPLDFIGLSILYPLNPFITALRLIQPYPKDIACWDNMNTLEPRHFGILSSQFNLKVHWPRLNISWPNYRELFRLGSNIVFPREPLSTEFKTRKKQISKIMKIQHFRLLFQKKNQP